MHEKTLGIVPLLVIVIGAVDVIALSIQTEPSNYQSWVFFGSSTCILAAFGMLVGYWRMMRASTPVHKRRVTRYCLQAGLIFLAWIIYLSVRSWQSLPSKLELMQSVELALLILMTILIMAWCETVLRKFLRENPRNGRPSRVVL